MTWAGSGFLCLIHFIPFIRLEVRPVCALRGKGEKEGRGGWKVEVGMGEETKGLLSSEESQTLTPSRDVEEQFPILLVPGPQSPLSSFFVLVK